MKIVFSDDNKVFEDFTSWALEDKNVYKKILSLIKDNTDWSIKYLKIKIWSLLFLAKDIMRQVKQDKR